MFDLWTASGYTRLLQGRRFFAKPDAVDNIKYNLKKGFKIHAF